MLSNFEKKQSQDRVFNDSGNAKRQRQIPDRFDEDSENTPVTTTKAAPKVCC